MDLYYIVLYPSPNYFRHFTVFAESVKDAIAKINYQARMAYMQERQKNPEDNYGNLSQIKYIIDTTRRYKRKYKPRFGTGSNPRACKAYKLPLSMVYEGHMNVIGRNNLVMNILPEIPLSEAQDLRNVG